MNQMEIFKNPEFGSIRTFEQNGKVLFCGKDIAQALGYRRPADAIAAHCKGVCVLPTPSNGGIQQMKFIPEGDVYRLIVHSKLPSAERFERWVFDEVLPSIRKHGAYVTQEKLWEIATSPEALLKLCTDLLAEREKNAALREDNARLQSKAVYYDLFIDLHHSTTCWNGGLSTALLPAACCPTPRAPTMGCSVCGTTTATATPAPTRW